MEESKDYDYAVEYAKSNRASCRDCKSLIAKDSLRLAYMVQSRLFDGKVCVYLWVYTGTLSCH